ncbi:hypothetical protein BU23DRAFT_126605 [Bimuria novae-zelandiae CBS 107.79]|uniref:Uncharacterized protein n=1 Tax=Bimuria novae-zelandiae CBS 107.79 TaxID=1447943 RepID=A0A6A5VB52_9PLEO|nr:hypothetical protein BU23DRAFT_126605 [Bimuria novae-zelandiae CBS 107.79]
MHDDGTGVGRCVPRVTTIRRRISPRKRTQNRSALDECNRSDFSRYMIVAMSVQTRIPAQSTAGLGPQKVWIGIQKLVPAHSLKKSRGPTLGSTVDGLAIVTVLSPPIAPGPSQRGRNNGCGSFLRCPGPPTRTFFARPRVHNANTLGDQAWLSTRFSSTR